MGKLLSLLTLFEASDGMFPSYKIIAFAPLVLRRLKRSWSAEARGGKIIFGVEGNSPSLLNSFEASANKKKPTETSITREVKVGEGGPDGTRTRDPMRDRHVF